MSKFVTGFILYRDANGVQRPVVGRDIYAQPDQLSALFAGPIATAPISDDPSRPVGFQRAIKTQTDANGAFSFKLPQTSETYFPGGVVNWLITDPISGLTYRGQVTDGLPPTNDLYYLVSVAGWDIIPSAMVSLGAANIRFGHVTFASTDPGTDKVIEFVPPMPNANYSALVCGATDDLNEITYQAYVSPGQTIANFEIRISALPPSPRTVTLSYLVIG